MWIIGRSCGEPRTSLKIEIPAGTYFVPRYYDVNRLAVLARLICDAGHNVRDAVVMTWRQADVLEALGRVRVRGDAHRSNALWALHGDAGASLPMGASEIRSLIATRFPTLQPRWVLILDPEASASSLGWLEAHVKMQLVSWLGRLLGDEGHPLHAVAVDRLDVHVLATMTSDPLEMIEIVENAVEHRLTYAFPAGIPVEEVLSGPVNVEELDWLRSLRGAAAQHLASRVNKLDAAIRDDAARVLLGLTLSAEQRDVAMAALVRAGLVLQRSSLAEACLSLARTVLGEDDSRVTFQDALRLSSEARKAIEHEAPRRRTDTLQSAERMPATITSSVTGRDAVAAEDLPQRFEELKQAVETPHPSGEDLTEFAEVLHRIKVDPLQVTQNYERAIAAGPNNAAYLGSYANFLVEERRDLDPAQELYRRAIAADPQNAHNLGNYALFLWKDRRELDQAQAYYERAIAADPQQAYHLGNYANFLWRERRELDQAQEFYERAIAARPQNANNLGNYANFLWEERRELDQAQAYYERAIAADPRHADNLGNYSNLLWKERRELDQAQVYYERAIAADPKHANHLGNYAAFLREERRELDQAQAYFERAIAADPEHAHNLGNYALFLCDERRDLDQARAFSERAMSADPNDVNLAANFAHVLFVAGQSAKAIEQLRKVINLGATKRDDLAAEIAYYRAVHLPEERDDALRALRALIAKGTRSVGWDFRAHAVIAENAGDVDAPFFIALAAVLSGKADMATLEAFPRWTHLSRVPNGHRSK